MNRASAKATSASGAMKRAGLRPAIGVDDTRRIRADPRRGGCSGERPGLLAQALRLGARGVARARPPAASWALAIERDALTSPPARPGCERGRQAGDAAALGADAGEQERGVRHQLAHAREVLRGGRAGDRADRGEAGLGSRPRRPPRRAPASRSHSGPPAASSRSNRSAAPGLEVRTSTKAPAPAACAASTNGASASRPSSGLSVTASAPRPGAGAERRVEPGEDGLGVGARAGVDVAALGVGDHEQALGAGVADGRPPARASRGSRGARSRRAAA